MDVNQLVSLMSNRATPFPEVESAPHGARYGDIPVERFVPPTLGIELAPDGDRVPNVILVYAPAAVGKSIMARHIARTTKNPYWDLAAFRLGSSFFSGTISQTYGVSATENFVGALRDGEITLVLDAADEASVGSTSTGYFAAIDDLCGLLRGTSPARVQAVIFGREETVLETAAKLESEGIALQALSVRYFAQAEARDFVKILAVESAGEKLLPEFWTFLDELFSKVMDAFGTTAWSEVESFLGYAPVLDSVATFYRTADNAYARLQEFGSPSSRLAVWELLFELILEIMERERDKFAQSFGGDHALKRAFAASAYEVQFQCRLLVAEIPDSIPAEPELNEFTDAEWLSTIDAQVHDWFAQHAFTPAFSANKSENPLKAFSNVAFRDFVVSLIADVDDRELLETTAAYLRAHDVNPSVMLSRFVEVRARRGRLGALPGALAGAIVDSHAAGGVNEPTLWIVEDSSEEDDWDDPGVKIVFGGEKHDSESVEVPLDCGSELLLGRQISNLVVHLPSVAVAFGYMVAEAQLGPQALIRCSSFDSRCPEVRAVGSGDQRVVVEARAINGATRLIHGDPESLSLRVPPVAYPWERFRVGTVSHGEVGRAELLSLGLELRTIAGWFSQGSGHFGAEKMNTILMKGRASRSMFDFCMREDCIWQDGLEYRFSAPFGLSTIRMIDLGDDEYRRWLERSWRFANMS